MTVREEVRMAVDLVWMRGAPQLEMGGMNTCGRVGEGRIFRAGEKVLRRCELISWILGSNSIVPCGDLANQISLPSQLLYLLALAELHSLESWGVNNASKLRSCPLPSTSKCPACKPMDCFARYTTRCLQTWVYALSNTLAARVLNTQDPPYPSQGLSI